MNFPHYSAPMPDGYYPDYSDQSDDQLDEFLCEYVDGTMDPCVRQAFEEYLEANPSLAQHARCLCNTRNMLCSYGGRHPAETLQEQIRHKVACELNRKNKHEALLFNRLGSAAMLTSVVSLMLIMGMMAGLASVNQQKERRSALAQRTDSSESMALPTDAYAQQDKSMPLEWYGKSSSWSVMGSSTVLPAIDMVPIGWNAASMDSTSRFQLIASP